MSRFRARLKCFLRAADHPAIPITSGNSIIPRNPGAEEGRKRGKEEERGFASADCRPDNSRRVARAQGETDQRLFRSALPLPHLPLFRPNDGCAGVVAFFGEWLITRQRPSEVSRPLDVSSLPFALTRTGRKFDDCAAD